MLQSLRTAARGLSLVVLATMIAPAFPAGAQDAPPAVKPSQRGTVSQQIAGTTVTLVYNRPVARGREIFGALVPFGRRWCPCADEATTIEVTTPVRLNGQALEAGRYSLWTIPTETTWTVIVNRRADTWHTQYPEGQDVLRLEATPRAGAHMETLAFYFPKVEGKTAELVLHWATMVVPLAIEVP